MMVVVWYACLSTCLALAAMSSGAPIADSVIPPDSLKYNIQDPFRATSPFDKQFNNPTHVINSPRLDVEPLIERHAAFEKTMSSPPSPLRNNQLPGTIIFSSKAAEKVQVADQHLAKAQEADLKVEISKKRAKELEKNKPKAKIRKGQRASEKAINRLTIGVNRVKKVFETGQAKMAAKVVEKETGVPVIVA